MKTSRAFTTALVTSLALLGIQPVTATAATHVSMQGPDSDGPHARADRPRAATDIIKVSGATIRRVDLGNITLGPASNPGKFRAPVRGQLISAPDARNAPLIIVNHLRYPACVDKSMAYPCPRNKERRYDIGMTYLGIALARAGYSTLITDLSPLYIPSGYSTPYAQSPALVRTVERMLTAVKDANAGKTTRFGAGLTGDIDTSRMGVIGHSRSGTLLPEFITGISKPDSKVVSAMAYGGAFDTEFHGRKGIYTKPMPDVPFLGVIGDLDGDTDFLGSLYLSQNIDQRRTSPALMAVVPRLGHTYINRALSTPKIDDRICLENCPGPVPHRQFLTKTTLDWFGATMRGASTDIPLRANDPLPAKLGGLPASWTAVTNGPRQVLFRAGSVNQLTPYGPVRYSKTCWPGEPMAPANADDCRPLDLGVRQNASQVTEVRLTSTSGVELRPSATAPAGPNARPALALHLAPTGDRADKKPANPLTIDVTTSTGRTWTTTFAGTEPALRNRATDEAAGTYPILTLRVPMPAWVAEGTITSVRLHTGATPSRFDVRAVDLVG